MPDEKNPFLSRGVALDLEVGKYDSIVHAFGAVRMDGGQSRTFSGGDLDAALRRLDDFVVDASFVLGHNLIDFDLPHLRAANPKLRLLDLPAVDTLRLSPLAFPRNPYHHLVKHYQDGGLRRRQLNDPELDARLALEVFDDQRNDMREAGADLLAAWHWLVTPQPEGADRALDVLFSDLRDARRPSDTEARDAIRAQLDGAGCARQCAASGSGTPPRRRRPRPAGHAGSPRRVGIGLCAGMAVRGRRQLGHAALGAPPVPGGRTAGAAAARLGLLGPRLRLVPGPPRSAQGTQAMVRLRRLQARARGRRRMADAAHHRPGGHDGSARPRDPAHGHGEVAVLPDPGAVTLRQDRRADGGDLAPGGAHGGPGGGTGGARHQLLRGGHRVAVHARARRRVGPGPAGRRGNPPRLTGAASRTFATPRPPPARDRRLGTGRGPLPVALGTRLQARLPLRGAFHRGEGRRRRGAAGAVPHGHRQAGRGGRHHPPLPRPARHRAGGRQRAASRDPT